MDTGVRERLRQAQQGDMNAFAELFEPLRGKVFAVACRIAGPNDAEDVVMDTFLKAWEALPGFGGRSSLKTWLLRIAANRARDVLRARGVRAARTLSDDDAEGAVRQVSDPTQAGPDEQAADREAQGLAARALTTLPGPHRQVLLLRYADGLSYADIAAAAGISIGTVMSRLFYARRKLREAYAREEEAS